MSSSVGARRRMGVLRGWLGGRVDDQMARRVAVALLNRATRWRKAKKRKTREAFSRRGFSFVLRWVLLGNLMVPRAGIEPARLAAGDFESPASTNFTTWADLAAHALKLSRGGKTQIMAENPPTGKPPPAAIRQSFRQCAKTVRASAGRDSGRTPSQCCARACARRSALRACGP